MLFGQHYITTGKFLPDEGRFYSQLQTMREKADYNCNWCATEGLVMPMIEPAKSFVKKIKVYVGLE